MFKGLKERRFRVALVIAVCLDVSDFLGGFLPVIGDLLDIVGMLILLPLCGVWALLPMWELIPFLDFLPFFIAAVVLARSKGRLNKKEVV